MERGKQSNCQIYPLPFSVGGVGVFFGAPVLLLSNRIAWEENSLFFYGFNALVEKNEP